MKIFKAFDLLPQDRACLSAIPTRRPRSRPRSTTSRKNCSRAAAYNLRMVGSRTGVADVAAFFVEKLKEAKAEEKHADEQRYRELTGRKAAEANYEELRDALRLAIGNGAKAAALRFTVDQASR